MTTELLFYLAAQTGLLLLVAHLADRGLKKLADRVAILEAVIEDTKDVK